MTAARRPSLRNRTLQRHQSRGLDGVGPNPFEPETEVEQGMSDEEQATSTTASTWHNPSVSRRRPRFVPQQIRAVFAAIYVVVLIAFAFWTGGIPRFDATGAWFWTGLLLIIMAAAFVEPFFGTPADAVANGSAVIVVAAAFPGSEGAPQLGLDDGQLLYGRILAGAYGVLALVLGLTTIALRVDPNRGKASEYRLFLARATRNIGAGRVAYSILFLLTAYAAFQSRPSVLFVAIGFWILVAIARPLEWLYLNHPRRTTAEGHATATVAALSDPGLVSLEAPPGASIEPGDIFNAGASRLEVLDTSILGEGTWAIASVTQGLLPRLGSIAERSGSESTTGVGYVDAGTDLKSLVVSVSPSRPDLHQGNIVSVDVAGRQVLYQIVAAQVKSSRLDEDITHSRVSVEAAKLGSWDTDLKRFVPTGWLPTPGAIVRAVPEVDARVTTDAIGSLPGTSLAVEPDVSKLVTHGTAILGVLGSGKSTFAHELIRRAAVADCKVLVIDTTPEYEQELNDVVPVGSQVIADDINTAISGTATQVADAVDRGGNRDAFRAAIRSDLESFLSSGQLVRVYDLTKFQVTKQVSFRDRSTGSAGFDACTLPEITAVIAEEALSLVKTERRSAPYLWVVLEEGHYLVPEFSSVSAKDDTKAVAQAVKVFLQGRKYGLGALVITQRTANVSKSLLTQCNTVFCFRAHDETTAGFLSERVGRAHVAALPTLADRQMLAFGRGIRCEDPLFLRVNDAATIKALLQEERARRQAEVMATDEKGSAGGLSADLDDLEPEEDGAEPWEYDANWEPPDGDPAWDEPPDDEPPIDELPPSGRRESDDT